MGIIQRQGLRSAIVRVVGMAIGAITTIFLIPAILSVEDIGLIDTMRKMITMGVPLLVMGGPQAIRKYFDPMRGENQSYTLISSYLYVFIFTATIFTLAYFDLKTKFLVSTKRNRPNQGLQPCNLFGTYGPCRTKLLHGYFHRSTGGLSFQILRKMS